MDSRDAEGTPVERVVAAVRQWPGVSLGPHPYDGVEFLLDDYEFGHVHHGWRSLHVNYPRRMRDSLIEAGETAAHPYFPNSGWTSYDVETTADVDGALRLVRVSYLYRASARRGTPSGRTALEAVDVAAELDRLDVSERVRDVFEDVETARATT
ncbi:MAG: luciferase family protein [Salinigranum sp.]